MEKKLGLGIFLIKGTKKIHPEFLEIYDSQWLYKRSRRGLGVIIFDLDGTLADCEHRRHFVKEPEMWIYNPEFTKDPMRSSVTVNEKWRDWESNWQAFYDACDKDTPIEPVSEILDGIYQNTVRFWDDVQIWSGRCESVRKKTMEWLKENILWDDLGAHIKLKMRPIGDSTPDDQLKERWLNETYEETKWGSRTPIQFVFDSDPKSIAMWRSHGIFVFDVNQSEKES